MKKKKNREDQLNNQGHELQQNAKKHNLLLPYLGGKDRNIIKSLKNKHHSRLPENSQTKKVYTATKLLQNSTLKTVFRLNIVMT